MLAFLFTEASNGPMEDSQTPFHLAARRGQCRAMRTLLAVRGTTHGLGIVDSYGDFPVHDAARGGQIDMMRFIVGLDSSQIDSPGNGGSTPLYYATDDQHNDLVLWLLTFPGFTPSRDSLLSAMYVALTHNYLDTIRLLYMQPAVRAVLPPSIAELERWMSDLRGSTKGKQLLRELLLATDSS